MKIKTKLKTSLNKKGFTIVELVIVIAVIAILAAVLVPTFSGIIQKANMSSDVQVCKNMNTQLGIDNVENNIDNIVTAKVYLKNAGYANHYVPVSSEYHYYWCEDDNIVYLINDVNQFEIYYPTTDTVVSKDSSYRLDLEYCLLTNNISGLTFSKSAAVVGEENIINVSGDSIPDQIRIRGNLVSIQNNQLIVNPEDTEVLEISADSNNSNLTEPTANVLTYNGEDQELITAGSVGDGTWQYKLESGEYSTNIPTGLNAGTYKVYYQFVGNNDNSISEKSIDVVIAKADPIYTAPSKLYDDIVNNPNDGEDDKWFELVKPGTTNGGQWLYKLGLDGEYSTEIPQAKDPDSYTVYFKLDGGINYNDIEEDSIDVEILACFAEGTKITMADGTNKNIEDVAVGDLVLTYNHEKGLYEAQKVYIAYAGAYKARAITLHFDNNKTLSIVGEHDLFVKETLKYETIFLANVEQFIGKHFYSAADQKYVELVSVTYETEKVNFYSLYTEYNTNCIAEGMLSCPCDCDELLNMYTFFEDLTIDHQQLEKDIKEYGLYEYQADTNYPFYTKAMHEAYRWNYMYILIGKGFNTQEYYFACREAVLSGNY